MLAIPYLNLFFFCALSFFANNDTHKREFSCSLRYFCALYLIIFIGFRGFVSTDWVNYYPFYVNLQIWKDIDFDYLGSFGWEIGTPLLMFILKKIGFDYFGFCFISAFIDLIIIFRFINKYSKNFYLSLIVFILYNGLTNEFNLLRNSKAIDLFLLSIDYIDNKKWKYILLNLLGYLFHVTALFFLLFFVIYQLNILQHKKAILLLWFAGLVIFSLKIQYINIILNIIADFLPSRLGWLVKRYTIFNKLLVNYGFGLGFIERFFSFLLIYLFQDKLIAQNKKNSIFIVMIYLYFLIFLYFAEIFELASRLTTLMVFSYWILLSNLYAIFTPSKKRLFVSIFGIYSLLKIFAIFGNDLSLQYENILFGAQTYNERRVNNLNYRFIK